MTIGIVGCGFWANYQVAAWRQIDPSLRLVFCDKAIENAVAMNRAFGGDGVYGHVENMLASESLDLVDIITPPATHKAITIQAAQRGIPVICQKPMALTLPEAREMVAICAANKVPLFVHENFRWQLPYRHLKQQLENGIIGKPFRARIFFNSGFPVFENQPALASLDKFILADLGVHLLDVARFLFGEAASVYCQTQRINAAIMGEDVATISLKMVSGLTCIIELSYASIVAYECFPQTLAHVEGEHGAISLEPDFRFVTTTREVTSTETIALPDYPWLHPQYAVTQGSMVQLHADFLEALRNHRTVETSGEDNLKSLTLMHAAYESARLNQVINFL